MRDDDPRPHHYEYAHRVLPSIVRRIGPGFVADEPGRDLTAALVGLWSDVGQRLPEEQRLDPAGLAAQHVQGTPPMLAITMPAAVHMVEAHYIVIAADGDATRYFVLEESWAPDRPRATVIGEWTADGHYNLGPGPDPDRDTFVHVVRGLLAGR
jgi:hypothetical protein